MIICTRYEIGNDKSKDKKPTTPSAAPAACSPRSVLQLRSIVKDDESSPFLRNRMAVAKMVGELIDTHQMYAECTSSDVPYY
jgi:hypothetical protein